MRNLLIAALATLLVPTAVLAASSAPAAAAAFNVRGSVNQVYTWGHPVGSTVELRSPANALVDSGPADAQGAKAFRDLAAGAGYTVVEGGTTSSAVTVTDPTDNPPQSFYGTTPALNEGYGYITMRDGTTLSANVTFPNDGSTGPWPVLLDYSGYDPSQPGQTPQEAQLYPHLGYVVVGVNMRGTTCSGGSFWFFEDAQRTDGYDVIETLAHQSWSNGDVGMVGISYSGYSQLYVAATNPPHLRAITPLSPFSDGYNGILYPGGILNDGFALGWAQDRQEAALPSAHAWVRSRISAGDTTCAANQVMRLQSQDITNEIIDGRFNDPKYRYLDPNSFAPQITVPTFLETQWQDEQTGGYGAELATMIAPHAKLHATFTNGTHVDSLGPEVFMKVAEFVDLYVGKRRPTLEGNAFYQQGVSDGLQSLFGTAVPITNYSFPSFSTYAEALAWYEAQPPITIRWENGGVAGKEGAPYSTVTTSYPSWPIPTAAAERWFLQPDGALAKTAPTVAATEARGASSYTYDPTTKRNTTFDGSTDAMWTSHPDVHWLPLTEGNSLSFVTPAFTSKVPYAGGGSADLWVKSTAADTDFEVTLTEVRPDGQEVEIQSGWLRASRRALDTAASTELRPRHTFQAVDAAPLPTGAYVPVRIELFPFAHIVRPGSRLRLNIEAPGGNQPFWAFSTLPGTATNTIAHSATMPSSVVLSKLSDNRVPFFSPSAAPSCAVSGVTTQSQSLRNQPCRTYLPARTPTAVTATVQGNQVQVAWQPPPAWPSGAALAGYRVTVAPGGDTVDVPAGSTTATYTGGANAGPFTFTVAAKYGTTYAPASDASLATTAPTPTDVTTKPGNGAVTVTWKAPPATGATVTGYVVTPYLGATAQTPKTFTTTALTQTLTGLTNGASLTFRVAAVYATAGAQSPPSAPVVVGAPLAVEFLSATPASQKAVVRWWPATDNGSTVTASIITPYVNGVAQSPQTFNNAGSTQTVTGLVNGTTYAFLVQAVNARGTGPGSLSAPVLVNPTVPGAPTGATAKVGDSSAVVAWSAPSVDGGVSISGYVVTPYIGATAQSPRPFSGTATTQTVTGLANGTSYTFTVAATNSVGTGTPSSPTAVITVGTPSAPAFLSGVPGNKQATLKWWPPASNGPPVTSIVITPYIGAAAQTPQVFQGANNTQTVTGLTNGVTYTFSVAAVNASGTGAASVSAPVLVNPVVASAPTVVTARSGAASASVSWRAPTTDGGSNVTGYIVTPYLGLVAQPAQTFTSTATTQSVTSLTNGSTYTFTVAAVNAAGTGPASVASTALLVGAPATPAFLSGTAGNGQVTLQWWPPTGNASPVTGYVITPYLGSVAQAPQSFPGISNNRVVSGLVNGTTYTFTVAAVNAFGPGEPARTGLLTPGP
ncbi:CocE/NonD family hydrolase [Aquihabitans sp. McL0605]|uniref:CocE/NonD family hydrolase n=1 Tax=Aquihabitans sp. McL0605 TaxID=3415671 RepID=UPI003CFA080E